MIEERSDFFLSLHQGFGPLGARPGALELSLELRDAPGLGGFGVLRSGLRRSHFRCIGRWASAPCSSWSSGEIALALGLAQVARCEE